MTTQRSIRYLAVLLMLGGSVACNAQSPQEVSGLIATAQNTGATQQDRLDALEKAANIDPLSAEEAAYSLVNDDSESVAVAAVNLLADSIVMSNHPAVDSSTLTTRQQEVMRRHVAAKNALYPALEDERASVRTIAARVLSSLSDTTALAAIESGVQQGVYGDSEAVNYYGLANTVVGAEYMLPYLAEGSTAAKQTAIQYLGRNTAYQNRVREEILMDAAEETPVRVAAASVLGSYDPNFLTYAAPLVDSTDLPLEVYTEVVESYLITQPDLSEFQIQEIRESLENYAQRDP